MTPTPLLDSLQGEFEGDGRVHRTIMSAAARDGRTAYELLYPFDPALSFGAVVHLDGWLRASDVVVGVGPLRNTSWFAERVAVVYSVEASSDQSAAEARSPRDSPGTEIIRASSPSTEGYLSSMPDGVDRDLVLVDCRIGAPVASSATQRLRCGGLLVIC